MSQPHGTPAKGPDAGTSGPCRGGRCLFADLDVLDDDIAVVVVGLHLLDEAVRLVAVAVGAGLGGSGEGNGGNGGDGGGNDDLAHGSLLIRGGMSLSHPVIGRSHIAPPAAVPEGTG